MANSIYTSTVPGLLHISGISVDFGKSGKLAESAEVQIGKSHRPIEHETGTTMRQLFSPPMELSLQVMDSFSLHLQHKTLLGMRTKHQDINFDTEDMLRIFRARGEQETQEYIKFHKKFKIVVELSGDTTTEAAQPVSSSDDNMELQPTTDEIIQICPWCHKFRIQITFLSLIIFSADHVTPVTLHLFTLSLYHTFTSSPLSQSRPTLHFISTYDITAYLSSVILYVIRSITGVGKSSLINHAFGVQNAIASHDKPGEAEIDTEFISQQNDRFVLHNSKGFEPGGGGNVKIAQDFLERRRNMPDLKDQLHAVWVCFEIPHAGGRLLETGMEEFLILKRDGKLGNIPVIVILTKYDMLVDRVDRTLNVPSLRQSGEDAIKKLIKKKVESELRDVCIRPLQKFAGRGIPHAVISTNQDHRETVTNLIRMTEDHIRQHLAPEASMMTSIAQRVDPRLKINASIEVGKRSQYQSALVSSTSFKNRTTWDCLRVLHTDIVAVWNFHDPDHHLDSPEFKTLMVNMVDKLDVGPTADPKKNMAVGLSMVGTIAGIMAALAGPAAPIVVPIAVGVVLAVWVRDVYQVSRAVLQRFMSYIVDLTLVMQTLYLIAGSQPLSRRAIKLAVKAYHDSPISGRVHTGIQQYDSELTFLDRRDRDTLDKIIELIQLYSIDDETIFELQEKIPAVGSADEPWEEAAASS
ncbi:hypothetical protein DFH29DRAFT_1003677 [Suillus ampliporus]|nr:hypothetical protein DFH29DRAFT_1003677 [Suillus ampliporus]